MKTILLLTVLTASAAFAQMEMPKPAPEHKKLDMFAGAWTLEGDMKAGPMSPAGKMTENEKCEWMDGNFFLICHSTYTSSMGNGAGLSVMGYSADDKNDNLRELKNGRKFENSKGCNDGDTWSWTSSEKMADKTVKGRFT